MYRHGKYFSLHSVATIHVKKHEAKTSKVSFRNTKFFSGATNQNRLILDSLIFSRKMSTVCQKPFVINKQRALHHHNIQFKTDHLHFFTGVAFIIINHKLRQIVFLLSFKKFLHCLFFLSECNSNVQFERLLLNKVMQEIRNPDAKRKTLTSIVFFFQNVIRTFSSKGFC